MKQYRTKSKLQSAKWRFACILSDIETDKIKCGYDGWTISVPEKEIEKFEMAVFLQESSH